MACTNTGTERTGICGLEQSGTISAVSVSLNVKLSAAGGVVFDRSLWFNAIGFIL